MRRIPPGLPLLLAALAMPSALRAQEPPDTARPDTAGIVVPIPPEARDTLGPELGEPDEDTDTTVTVMPAFPRPVPAGWSRGVWEWDREEILGTRALTLTELLAETPGVIPIRAGDYGQPRTVTSFGLGAGRVRIFRDGFEVLPLEGSVVDLSRVSIAGVERVRVERHPGEIRIHLESLQLAEPRPWSLVEAGTGDLDTNFFRGSFSHPRAFGGAIAVALDRIDTEGAGRREPGASQGVWARYVRTWGERWGVSAEIHRFGARHDTDRRVADARRSDWILRGRMRVSEGLVADAFYGRSSLEANDDDPRVGLLDVSRSQAGLRVALDRSAFWGIGTVRLQDGGGVPGTVGEVEAGVRVPGFLQAAGRWTHEDWDEGTASRWRASAWSEPLAGVTVFGSLEDGRSGASWLPSFPPPSTDPDAPAVAPGPVPAVFTERSALRAGAAFDRGGLHLGGAVLRLEADSLRPFRLPFDSAGVVLPGGTVTGWEAEARIPLLLLDGLALEGSVQFWSDPEIDGADPGGDPGALGPLPEWRYLPSRTWHGRIDFHDVFLESGNLELWAQVGSQGRQPMTVPVAPEGGGVPPARVPFHQSWYAWVQVRVVSVRVFILWENFTVKEDNRDFPGTSLPQTRALYGVRWTLWN